jgi:hypothetical protein
MANTVTFTALLKDQFTNPLSKMASKSDAAFAKINSSLDKTSTTGKRTAMSIKQIDDRLDLLNKQRAISIDVTAIKTANKEIQALEKEKNKLTDTSTSTGGGFMSALGTIGGIYGAYEIGKSIITLRAEKEKMEAVLSTTFDSKFAGSKAMDDLDKFASDAPFKMEGVEKAFEDLSIHGYKPSMKEMKKMGDVAAGTGKDMEQFSQAIFSAQMGMFRPLKQFGIKAKADGDMVAFTFKGVTTEVKNTDDAITKYMISLGDVKGVSGSMAAVNDTLSGSINRLDNNWTIFKENLGKSHGVISSLMEDLNDLLKDMNKVSEAQWNMGSRGLSPDKDIFSASATSVGDLVKAWTGNITGDIGIQKEKVGMVVNEKMDKLFENFNDKMDSDITGMRKMEMKYFDALSKIYGNNSIQSNKFLEEWGNYETNWKKEKTTTSDTESGSGAGKFDSGVSDVSGSAQVKNIYITITKMVGAENVTTTTIQEGAEEIGILIDKHLLTAVNDANRMAD